VPILQLHLDAFDNHGLFRKASRAPSRGMGMLFSACLISRVRHRRDAVPEVVCNRLVGRPISAMKHYVTINGMNVSKRWLKKHPNAYRIAPPFAPIKQRTTMPTMLTPTPQNRLGLSEDARELFLRMWAQVAPHERANFNTIYELSLPLFHHVFGVYPCDVPRFQQLRDAVANGKPVPLFDSPNTPDSATKERSD